MSNSLDPDQARYTVWLDLAANICLLFHHISHDSEGSGEKMQKFMVHKIASLNKGVARMLKKLHTSMGDYWIKQ